MPDPAREGKETARATTQLSLSHPDNPGVPTGIPAGWGREFIVCFPLHRSASLPQLSKKQWQTVSYHLSPLNPLYMVSKTSPRQQTTLSTPWDVSAFGFCQPLSAKKDRWQSVLSTPLHRKADRDLARTFCVAPICHLQQTNPLVTIFRWFQFFSLLFVDINQVFLLLFF